MRTGSIVVALIAGLAGGCKDKSAPKAKPVPPAAIDAAAPPSLDAAVPTADAAPAPLTPPPGARGVQINDLQYGGFVAPGLPAIKDDGSALAAISVADDGGRGYLDLRFVVIDGATGKVATALHLADPNETSDAEAKGDQAGTMDVETALATKVRERVAQANAVVGAGTWRTLVTTARGEADPPEPNESLAVDDVRFSYDLAARRLTVTKAGKQVAVHDLAKLVSKPSTRTDTPCPGDLAYLAAVHVDAPSKKVLVELGAYSQGHNCGSNGPSYAVIPLP